MLRALVLLLILLNAAYYAWSRGALEAYGLGPADPAEPQRVTQQIHPQAIHLLAAEDARRAEQAALNPPRPAECLLAGPFDDAEAAGLRRTLESGWPAGSWSLEPSTIPARWIIYMGKFPSDAVAEHKRAELEHLKIDTVMVDSAELQPGLALGRFEAQAQAQAELGSLQKRGVHTARVLQERPEIHQTLLRLPTVDDAMRARLDPLKASLGDKPLHACH